MAVNTQNITSGPYNGDGVNDTFSYTFRIDEASEVAVYESVNGVDTLLTLNTDYTVQSVGDDNGGLIKRTAGVLPVGSQWYIRADYKPTQVIVFASQGGFFPQVHEYVMDKLTFLMQQVMDRVGRSIRLSDSDLEAGSASLTLPKVAARANKFLAFDNAGGVVADTLMLGDIASSVADNLLTLRTGTVVNGSSVLLQGHTTLGGGGGEFIGYTGAAAGTYVDNNGTVIVPNGGDGSAAWVRSNVDYVTPEMFGALGDGVTDDTISLNAALQAAPGYGFILLNKTHLITSNVQVQSNTVIKGIGGIVGSTGVDYPLDIVGKSNIIVDGISIDGVGQALSCVRVLGNTNNGCNNISIINTNITGTIADAFLFHGGIEVSSTDNALGRNTNIHIYDNNLNNLLTHGAVVAYTDSISFHNNKIDTVSNHGMEAVGCTDVIISNNHVRNCTLSGLGVGSHTKDWTISDNIIIDCAGDGSITCEHNSVFGVISNNIITDCNSNGINISYGTPTTYPFDTLRNIKCVGNSIKQKSGITTRTGINCYAGTGAAVGVSVDISNNLLDGFNRGVTTHYLSYSNVNNNTIINLTGINSHVVSAVFCTRHNIEHNTCNTDTGSHAYQVLNYGTSESSFCNVSHNFVQSANGALDSVVYIEGTKQHIASNNMTAGAAHYVSCASSLCNVVANGNQGGLTSTAYSGVGIKDKAGVGISTTVGTGGSASVLPANPVGYTTLYIEGYGNAKVPYYSL